MRSEGEFVQIDDSFEVIDVIVSLKNRPHVRLDQDSRILYVDRVLYDKNMTGAALKTSAQIYNQLQKDITRSAFLVGPLNTHVRGIDTIPVELQRFCTQAVLALPIELVVMPETFVFECEQPSRMHIKVYDDYVYIRKKLRLLSKTDQTSFEVRIYAYRDEPFVKLCFKCGHVILHDASHLF